MRFDLFHGGQTGEWFADLMSGWKSEEYAYNTPRLMVAGPRASKWRDGYEVARKLVLEISCL